MNIFIALLLFSLIGCALVVCLTKGFLTSIVIYMSYSLVMSVIWFNIESPDLAITEAAVGAGVTSLLFFATLKKIDAIDEDTEDEIEEAKNE
ncbi:MAG: DUF4040 domain-containing protein [Eubacteriales bacterium]|nr:DUF4040 domain-containing protein [Eubacteriales bacterium]